MPSPSRSSPPKRRSSLKDRRSSLQGYLLSRQTESNSRSSLLGRIFARMAERANRDGDGDQDDEDEGDEEDDLDLMEDRHLDLLCTPPAARSPDTVNEIMEFLPNLAPDIMGNLSEDNLGLVACTCLYHFFGPGEVICEPDEDAQFFFIVLRGVVDVEEPTLHHQEHHRGLNPADGSWQHRRKRTTEWKEGEAFSHLPLATGTAQYGYMAKVGDPYEGASLLILPKETYEQVLQRGVERSMSRAVATLRATHFFASWSERSMERLYFWFTRQTFAADEDLVKHGEKADSCFVILSGRCNVIVPLNEEELAEQAAEQARNAPPKRQSKLRRKSTHGEEEGGPAPRRNSVSGRTSNAHGEGESGPPARRNSVVGASGPVEEVSDGSDRLQGPGGHRRSSVGTDERAKMAASALAALGGAQRERRSSCSSMLEAVPAPLKSSEYAQYVSDKYDKVVQRTVDNTVVEVDSDTSAEASFKTPPNDGSTEPSFKGQRRNSLVDAVDSVRLRTRKAGDSSFAGGSAHLPRRNSCSITSVLGATTQASDPLPRRNSSVANSVLAAAADASANAGQPGSAFANVVMAAQAAHRHASCSNTMASLDNLLNNDSDEESEPLEEEGSGARSSIARRNSITVSSGDKFMNTVAGLSSDLQQQQRRRMSVAGVDEWTGASFRRVSVLGDLPTKADLNRRMHGVSGGMTLPVLPSQGGQCGFGALASHVMIAGVMVPNTAPPDDYCSDSSSSSSEEDEEDVSDEEREDWTKKKIADREARKAEKMADKMRAAATAAAEHVRATEEEKDEPEENMTSTFKRWQKAQTKARVIAAQKKKADAILAKAVEYERRAARAADRAKKVHMEVEMTSFRRRQSLIEEMMEEEGMHAAAADIQGRRGSQTTEKRDSKIVVERREQRGTSQRGMSVLMQGADAFKTTLGPSYNASAPPLYANFRHVVTIHTGALVGEIALLRGERRMATVRAAEPVEALVLDKNAFFNFDVSTLHIIRDQARFNAAVSRGPDERTEDDLLVLQQRTAMVTHFAGIDVSVHRELCRVAKYRKVTEGVVIVRKGQNASIYYIIISGEVGAYKTDPREVGKQRRNTLRGIDKFLNMSRQRESNVDHFRDKTPDAVYRAGQALAEEDLWREDEASAATLVALDTTELLEVSKKDYDHIMRGLRKEQHMTLVSFLSNLPITRAASKASIDALAHVATRRRYLHDQLCLAHPPNPNVLASASFCVDHVYLVFSGEAQLYCAAPDDDSGKSIVSNIGHASHTSASGKVANASMNSNAAHLLQIADKPLADAKKVEQHMGGRPIMVATLGRGEVIIDGLMPHNRRWCMRASGQLELVMIPRKEWADTVRSVGMNELRSLSAAKSAFYETQMQRALQPQPEAYTTFPLWRSLSRPQSLSSLPSATSTIHQLLRSQRQPILPPGAFISGGYGHGVVVPPPRLPLSMSSDDLPKQIKKIKSSPPSVTEYVAIHHSSSPGVHYRHWSDELDKNPAFLQKSPEKTRRPRRVTS